MMVAWMKQAGALVGIETWINLKSIKKMESIASSDCFQVVGKKEVRVRDDVHFPSCGLPARGTSP